MLKGRVRGGGGFVEVTCPLSEVPIKFMYPCNCCIQEISGLRLLGRGGGGGGGGDSVCRDTTKPGLWTMDWTTDWTVDK